MVVFPERWIAIAIIIYPLSDATSRQVLPVVQWSHFDDLDPCMTVIARVVAVVMVIFVVVMRIMMVVVMLVLFL